MFGKEAVLLKVAVSYSFGKDSALALHRAKQMGHEPMALVATVNEAEKRSWFHGVPEDLMRAAADSLSVPLLLCRCRPEAYQEAFEAGLRQAAAMGAEAVVFGDIDTPGHREWDEARCAAAGLGCLLPLWLEDREAVTREELQIGIQALLKIVRLDCLPASYAGRLLTEELALAIREAGADMCGENGEYHTFVFDGPDFRWPVPVENRGIVDLGGYAAADLALTRV